MEDYYALYDDLDEIAIEANLEGYGYNDSYVTQTHGCAGAHTTVQNQKGSEAVSITSTSPPILHEGKVGVCDMENRRAQIAKIASRLSRWGLIQVNRVFSMS